MTRFVLTPAALRLLSVLVCALGLCVVRSNPSHRGWAVLVWLWGSAILLATLTPVYGRQTLVQLVPFRGPLDSAALNNFVANVGLFAPLGLLLGLAYQRGIRHVIWCSAAASIFIELTQWSTGWGRSVDTTDVILNVIGGAVGAVVAVRVAGYAREKPAGAQPLRA